MTELRAYLDHAASSPLLPAARAAMDEAWGVAGNPHALHGSGRAARRLLEDARESLAVSLDCRPGEVIFTSGGTEANNLAVVGGLTGRAALEPQRRRLVLSGVEHPSIDEVRRRWPERVDVLEVSNDGVVCLDGLRQLLSPATGLVTVMLVNNETGTIQPVTAVAESAHASGAWVHTDAIQALGHVPLSFAELDVDALSVSAHKVGGPVGVGALVLRRDRRFTEIGFGGGQERRLRSGTVPAALAAGFAAAAAVSVSTLAQEAGRLAALRAAVIEALATLDPTARVNGGHTSPAILNVTFPGLRADDLLLLLDRAGIDASTGSACLAGVHQPSRVLQAMGSSLDEAGSSLRFSFGWTTTGHDLDRLLAALPAALEGARAAFH